MTSWWSCADWAWCPEPLGPGPTLVVVTTLRFTVTDDDTAIALGSGDVPVLATPRLLAWMEAATVVEAATRVDATSTTVGVEVWMRHRRASIVGALVEVEVTDVAEQDRGLSFEVVAREVPATDSEGAPGREIASGRVVRAIVDRGAFLSRE
jgi:fluoroacetyl-CoA thioesterase